MEPLTIDRTHILVLNYNGRGLARGVLAEHPRGGGAVAGSVPRHGRRQQLDRRVARAGRAAAFPRSGSSREPNHGLASFNSGARAAATNRSCLLLNNDVKLDANAVGPLLARVRDP